MNTTVHTELAPVLRALKLTGILDKGTDPDKLAKTAYVSLFKTGA